MITVKRIFCVVLSALLCLSLCACSSTEPPTSPLEQLHGVLNTDTDEAVAEYRIVLPSDATSELAIAARALAQDLAEQTEVEVTVWYEHEQECFDENARFLLLGWVEQAQSEMRTFKSEDYVCRMREDGSVLLGGKSESATLTAMERFIQEILPAASATSLMHEDAGFFYVAEYSVAKASLNGFALWEYRIVTDEENPDLWILANWLQKEIEKASGDCLSVLDRQRFDGKGRAIFLETAEQNHANGQAHVMPIENGIRLLAEDVYGVSVAVQEFVSLLKSDISEGILTSEIRASLALPYECSELLAATMCVAHLLPLDEVSKLYTVLDSVQGSTAQWVLIDRMSQPDSHYLEEASGVRAVRAIPTKNGNLVLAAQISDQASVYLATDPSERGDLLVTDWQIGAKSKLRMVVITGVSNTDQTVELEEILSSSTLPTVVVVHTQNENATISVSGVKECGYSLVSSEQYKTSFDGATQSFSVYTKGVSVELIRKNDVSGYREFRVRRLFAIEDLSE